MQQQFNNQNNGSRTNQTLKHPDIWVSYSPLEADNNGNGDNSETAIVTNSTIPNPEKPDAWNYALVLVLAGFYLMGMGSNFASMQLLFHLLSGGGISIPIFGNLVSITDVVSFMGTGVLEYASLSDAYLEHKNQIQGKKKWLSRGGRFLAFIAQWSMYYMSLGTLMFAKVDATNLSTQTLEAQPQETALVLNPPTVLHGVFVGSVTGAWSYATTYMGPDALLVAISALRRKKKVAAEAQEPQEPQEDIWSILEYIFNALYSELRDLEMQKEMEAIAAMLQQIYTRMDSKQLHNDFAGDFEQALVETINKIPEALLKQKGYNRQQLQKLITEMQSQQQNSPDRKRNRNSVKFPFNPSDWYGN